MKTNVDGVFFFAREVGKVMIAQNYGKIINIGSFHCQVTMNGVPRSGYSTAKGAVLMMSKALAAEWAKNNITVNVLGPGYFASEMSARLQMKHMRLPSATTAQWDAEEILAS